jgi:hypothetical protein
MNLPKVAVTLALVGVLGACEIFPTSTKIVRYELQLRDAESGVRLEGVRVKAVTSFGTSEATTNADGLCVLEVTRTVGGSPVLPPPSSSSPTEMVVTLSKPGYRQVEYRLGPADFVWRSLELNVRSEGRTLKKE